MLSQWNFFNRSGIFSLFTRNFSSIYIVYIQHHQQLYLLAQTSFFPFLSLVTHPIYFEIMIKVLSFAFLFDSSVWDKIESECKRKFSIDSFFSLPSWQERVFEKYRQKMKIGCDRCILEGSLHASSSILKLFYEEIPVRKFLVNFNFFFLNFFNKISQNIWTIILKICHFHIPFQFPSHHHTSLYAQYNSRITTRTSKTFFFFSFHQQKNLNETRKLFLFSNTFDVNP